MVDAVLGGVLRGVRRRYVLVEPLDGNGGPSSRLAVLIEEARVAMAEGETPGPAQEAAFVSAMSDLIQDALREENGDPVFQALVLKQRSQAVREHAALAEQANPDKRRWMTRVNALAHPGKLGVQRTAEPLPAAAQQKPPTTADSGTAPSSMPSPLREALLALHTASVESDWHAVEKALQALNPLTDLPPGLQEQLQQLSQEPALQRLGRLAALQGHADVQQYQSLREQQGPQANSRAASLQGAASRRRGAEVETLALQALQALADRLNAEIMQAAAPMESHAKDDARANHQPAPPAADRSGPYRAVSSLRVPGPLAAGQEGAKTEWDVVLLKQAPDSPPNAPRWNIVLLVEAKAAADAASTDLPRLIRGLQLLAQADPARHYAFAAREGIVQLRGASLHTLPTHAAGLENTVIYCSDGPADNTPRLLSAASRMLLLSAEASLAYAVGLLEGRADTATLHTLWQQLLNTPQWKPVLEQTLALRQARELMVHTDDLLQAATTPVI